MGRNHAWMMWALVVLLMFMAKMSAAADPPAPLPKTGQTTSYATGDDGDLRKGVEKAGVRPRFWVRGDGTTTDQLTGLTWKTDPGDDCTGGAVGGMSWVSAMSLIYECHGSAFAGHTDWRMPTVNELASLVHAGKSSTAVWLNEAEQGFSNVQAAYYWSFDYVTESFRMWAVNLTVGDIVPQSQSSVCYAWPVRGGTPPDFVCGDPVQGQMADRHSNLYDTVEIGGECWMAASMNAGVQLTGAGNFPSDIDMIEKHCYNDDSQNCANDGALYTWWEAVGLPHEDASTPEAYSNGDVPGICPPGWHVPSNADWHTLTGALKDAHEGCSSSGTTYDTCRPAGDRLKESADCSGAYPYCGDSGFEAKLGGYQRTQNGDAFYKDTDGYYWSSNHQTGNMSASKRTVRSLIQGVNITDHWESSSAILLRCVRD